MALFGTDSHKEQPKQGVRAATAMFPSQLPRYWHFFNFYSSDFLSLKPSCGCCFLQNASKVLPIASDAFGSDAWGLLRSWPISCPLLPPLQPQGPSLSPIWPLLFPSDCAPPWLHGSPPHLTGASSHVTWSVRWPPFTPTCHSEASLHSYLYRHLPRVFSAHSLHLFP